MPKDLSKMFSPQSVAVVGASTNSEKVGAIVLKNIIDSNFKGIVYPVNPSATEILGLQTYKSVMDLPSIPELAIIAIPAAQVAGTMAEIVKKGIKNVVLLTAGYKEIGEEGAKLEKELKELCDKNGINLLGPNCMGFINNMSPINASFGKASTSVGNLRFISQSGAITASLLDWCNTSLLGFSHFITLGNKASVTENDVLEYLAESETLITSLSPQNGASTNPIGLYLESISDGKEFVRIVKQITRTNPVFIIKPGKSEASATAMKSHTGAIAGNDDVLEAALEQAGAIRTYTLENFFNLAKAFSWDKIPSGPKLAIVSNAGGPAVLSTDAAISEGLEIARFDDKLKEDLAKVLPRAASIIDPVDIMGDALADRYAAAAELVLKSGECDALLMILTPQVMTQIDKSAELIGELYKKYQKPIFCSFVGGKSIDNAENLLNKLKIPVYRYPEEAVQVIGQMWRFQKNRLDIMHEFPDIRALNTQLMPEAITKVTQDALKKNYKALDNGAADQVIKIAGINSPESIIANTIEDAKAFATKAGYPVVLKISSPGLLHKKNIGGVVLHIRDDAKLEDAWETLLRKVENLDADTKKNVSFQIQKEVPEGVEVLIGVKRDPTFGPVLLFGAGGSNAELIADKNLHLLPIEIGRAKHIVSCSKIYKLLAPKEAGVNYALDKLYQVIINLCNLATAVPEISEIEINPVVVTLNDVWAVDPKIILDPKQIKPAGPRYKIAKTLSVKLLAGKARYFEFESETPLNLEPGQYVSVKVSDTRINCYSVAGQPSATKFDLLVDSTPGGPGSKFFETLKEGDKMAFLGPFGTFKVHQEDGAARYLFLCTGTGFAPLKNMIESIFRKDPGKEVRLYLGIATYNDIYFVEYFEGLKSKFNFDYKIAIYEKSDKWHGPVGYINDVVRQDYKNATDLAVYMCGNKNMIAECTTILEKAGCASNRLYSEKF